MYRRELIQGCETTENGRKRKVLKKSSSKGEKRKISRRKDRDEE